MFKKVWLVKLYSRNKCIFSSSFSSWHAVLNWFIDYSSLYPFDTVEVFKEDE